MVIVQYAVPRARGFKKRAGEGRATSLRSPPLRCLHPTTSQAAGSHVVLYLLYCSCRRLFGCPSSWAPAWRAWPLQDHRCTCVAAIQSRFVLQSCWSTCVAAAGWLGLALYPVFFRSHSPFRTVAQSTSSCRSSLSVVCVGPTGSAAVPFVAGCRVPSTSAAACSPPPMGGSASSAWVGLAAPPSARRCSFRTLLFGLGFRLSHR